MLALTPFYRHALYDPFKEFDRLERRIFGERAASELRFDLYEKDETYIIEADLPGFSKSDINVEFEPPYLTVRATREAPKVEGEGCRYIHSERYFGTLERTFDVAEVDAGAASVTFENGVLRLVMPKKRVEKSNKFSLPIE